MLKTSYQKTFVKDYKRVKKRGWNLKRLEYCVTMISEQEIIPAKYDDHILTGNWNGYRELHISSDWLLVYKYTDEGVIFIRTGSHSDIF